MGTPSKLIEFMTLADLVGSCRSRRDFQAKLSKTEFTDLPGPPIMLRLSGDARSIFIHQETKHHV
jgi:hypothetical protein